jgi:hypothetical protein
MAMNPHRTEYTTRFRCRIPGRVSIGVPKLLRRLDSCSFRAMNRSMLASLMLASALAIGGFLPTAAHPCEALYQSRMDGCGGLEGRVYKLCMSKAADYFADCMSAYK